MPVKSSGVLMERGAKKLGLTRQPEPHRDPVAALSTAARPASTAAFASFFGCEVGAKSSTLATMIPLAEASGRCEIRPECTAVFRIETDARGRVNEVLTTTATGASAPACPSAVILSRERRRDAAPAAHVRERALPRRARELERLVGRNLMFNAHTVGHGVFAEPLNDYKGVQVTRIVHDFYESDPARGFYGGGGLDARPLWSATPILHALMGMPPDVPPWGAAFKDAIAHNFTRQMCVVASTTSLPLDRNNITLDPESKDRWGRPGIRVTYRDHRRRPCHGAIPPRARPWPSWMLPAPRNRGNADRRRTNGGAHLLGTCRMGDDPATSVVDRDHRSHDVPNLFICDGSSFVTSGRGQPTMTIMALAFRAADRIRAAAAAKAI